MTGPLVGITFLPLIANTVYAVIGLSYRSSLLIALAMAALVLLTQRRRLPWRHGLLQLATAAVTVSILTLLMSDARSILLNGPAIFFKYGTDQSGYAVIGDWLLRFPIQVRPVDDGGLWPYQSFPEILFNVDPRFGTFGFLALVGAVTKTDSLFSYPLATAVVIGSAALSCSALFCRRWSSFLFCFLCLLASQWVDYGYVGFLGRTIAYPSVLLLVGFCLLAIGGSKAKLSALVAIAGGVGTAYPGFIVGVLATSILLPCVVLRRIGGDREAFSADAITAIIITIAVPTLSSGTASRPVPIGQILQGLDWQTVISRVLDIDDRSLPVTGFLPDTVMALTSASLAFALVLVAYTIFSRQGNAVAFMVGPLALTGALFATGRVSSVQEFAGFPYPALVVGSVLLADTVEHLSRVTVYASLTFQALIRLPRLYAVISLFGYVSDPNYILTLAEIKQIEHDIGSRSFEIDTGTDVGRALWLMPELGQRAGQCWWSQETWRTVLSYRPAWTYKAPPSASQLRVSEDLIDNVYHHFKIEPVSP